MSSGVSASDHGRLMDTIYRYTRHVYDITRKYYLLGRDRCLQSIPIEPGDVTVEVGCGTARNLKYLARRHPAGTFAGVDASTVMLQTAQKSLEKAGLNHVPLVCCFAETLDPKIHLPSSHQNVRHMVFSYCLTMIPPWKAVLDRAWELTPPGGTISIVDFGTFDGWPSLPRQLFLRFLKAFHVTPVAEIHSWALDLGPNSAEVQQENIAGGYAVLTRVLKR